MMKFMDHPRLSSSRVSHSALFLFALVIVGNTLYVTTVLHQHILRTENVQAPAIREVPEQPVAASSRIPEVLIVRRTKKTGSMSGLEAIMKALLPEGYTALYNESNALSDIVRGEAHKVSPRKLIVACHNGISREHTGNRFTVITDTIKDGYQQITSFCRYVRDVEDCDSDEMRECLRSAASRFQMRYRWTGREKEDEDTYIDLPLSVAHPALSATVFRRVFPDKTLDIAQNNVYGSSCAEIPNLRKIYDEYFLPLDEQVLRLRERILTLAGYPSAMEGYTVVQLLDAAEKTEQAKYNLEKHEPTKHHGDLHLYAQHSSKGRMWYITEDGRLEMKDMK